MKQEMKFRFYGQNVEAVLIDGDRERADVWAIWVDGEFFGNLRDFWKTDEKAVMRFIEKRILENLKGC